MRRALAVAIVLGGVGGCGTGERTEPAAQGSAPAAAQVPSQAVPPEPVRSAEDAPAPAGGAAQLEAYVFRCPSGIDLQVFDAAEDGAIDAVLNGNRARLVRTAAASGARYADERLVVWMRAGEALLQRGSVSETCTEDRRASLEADARRRGVKFRAIGQEPGWLLEVLRERIELRYDYGQERASVPLPPRRVDPVSGASVYAARTEAHVLEVRITPLACSDVMSGESFPSTVEVRLDGREFRGCGHAPAGELP